MPEVAAPVAPLRGPALPTPGQLLGALNPAFRLSERLQQDSELTLRGSRLGRRLGAALGLAGLLLVVVEGMMSLGGGGAAALAGGGWALAVGGAATAVACLFWPAQRQLRVHVAPSQAAEWQRVQDEAQSLAHRQAIALGAAAGGLLLAALSFRAFGPAWGGAFGGLGLLVALAGGGFLLAVTARRAVLRRLYVQTFLLARLEESGVVPAGISDPRVAPVLKALDQLLGALPEASVRNFLASPEAEAYLQLMDELHAKGARRVG